MMDEVSRAARSSGSADRYGVDDLPPPIETMTVLTGRCVILDDDGNPPPGERLFNVREIPSPYRVAEQRRIAAVRELGAVLRRELRLDAILGWLSARLGGGPS